MIAVKTLLAPLGRPEVTEVVLRTGKPPTARAGSGTEEVDGRALSGDDVVQLLFSAGGSRYVESLGSKPTQWRTRVEGVGPVTVSATMSHDVIEARFALQTPLAKPRAASVPPARAPKSVRAPRPDGDGAPPSRRKGRGQGRSERPPEPPGGVPTPRAHELALLDQKSAPPTVPPPRMFDVGGMAPPPPRGELKTLPSVDVEIDLELGATDIPSVPHPVFPDEVPPGPISPRTLPEARFSRDPVAPSPTRLPAVTMAEAPRAPAIAAPRDVHEAPTPSPFDAGASFAGVAELTEPFAQSVRVPSLTPAPPARPARSTTGRTTRPFAREPHTAVFRKLLRAAREAGASDLHLVADRPPLLRVLGQVTPRGDALEARVVEDMILSRVPSRLAATLDHDGSCDFALDEPELGRFRVNVSRQRTGIKASLRLIGATIPTLSALGLPDVIALATRFHQGLIVLTGPTGHGKTTTLAAVVDILNRETTRHLITVEDPIEYVHPRKKAMLSQREVGTHTRSFQTALKASLREDPDVIVVGELRDAETVRMAIAASETGHLVLGTMNTPSAAKTIDRLIDLFPPGDQAQVRMTLAGGLRLIVSQRLLPEAQGRGMVAAAEVLPGMVPLWNLIRDNRTYQIPSLQQRGKALGVIRLDDSLADLVRAGRTSAAAAMAVAEAPDELEAALGIRRPSATMPATPQPPRAQTSPVRPPDPGQAPKGGGFLERAGAIFGGKKGV
jgi:twitching motility protein PilT